MFALANPAWLLLALLGLVVLALHVRRRRSLSVPNLRIWRAITPSVSPHRRLQIPPWSLPLILQLLAVLLLSAALAEPLLVSGNDRRPVHRIMVLDASSGMQSLDGGTSRFSQAIQAIEAQLRDRPPDAGDRLTVVMAAPHPQPILARLSSGVGVSERLRRLAATDGLADWGQTAGLVRGLLTDGERHQVQLFTDATTPAFALPEGANAELRVVRLGRSDIENAALAGVSATPLDAAGRWRIEGTVVVRESGAMPAGASAIRWPLTVTVRFQPSGSPQPLPWATAELARPAAAPGAEQKLQLSVDVQLPGPGALEAALPDDDGPQDNRAFLVLNPPSRPVRVLEIGPENRVLVKALQSIPGVAVYRADAVPANAADFDLVVVDGVRITARPETNVLWLGNAGLKSEAAGAAVSDPEPNAWDNHHPLSRGVNWQLLRIKSGVEVERNGITPILESGRTALVAARNSAGGKEVWLAFDLETSNWPELVGFPVFLGNLFDWMRIERAATSSCQVGAECALHPRLLSAESKLFGPAGVEEPRLAQAAVIAATPAPGWYPDDVGDGFVPTKAGIYWLQQGAARQPVAVNPAVAGVAATGSPPTVPNEGQNPQGGTRALWTILLLLVLASVIAEAWVAARGAEPFFSMRALARGNPLAGRRRVQLGLRVATLVALVLAVANVGMPGFDPIERTVLVFSPELPGSAPSDAYARLRQEIASRSDDAAPAVVAVGPAARILSDAGVPPATLDAPVESSLASNLRAAIEMGAALVPPAYQGRVLLASDGSDTRGDVWQGLRAAQGGGMKLDYYPLRGLPPHEIVVDGVEAAASVKAGESFPLNISLFSQSDESARVRVLRGQDVLLDRDVQLGAGKNRVSTTLSEMVAGRVRYDVEVLSAGDTFAENNKASAVIDVAPALTVAIVVPDRQAERAEPLVRALAVHGHQTSVVTAPRAPFTVEEWLRFDVIALMNLPAIGLDTKQQDLIKAAVKEHGRGLLILGGENTFGPGGYYETALEDLSPLSSKAPRESPKTALAFVLDRSGSMQMAAGAGNRLDVAKQATLAAAALLNKESEIAVVVFDSVATVVLPLQPVGEMSALADALRPIEPGGGTSIYPGLVEAYDLLTQSKAAIRHVVVMTDGLTQPGDFNEIVGRLKAEGITVSTIAIGEGADAERLVTIARDGGGAHYATRDFGALPGIMAKEALLLGGTLVEQRAVQAEWLERPDFLGNLSRAPRIGGYVITTAKPDADVHLTARDKEGETIPILASWRYGAGRVVSLATQSVGPWVEEWMADPEFALFWSQALRFVQPETERPGLNLSMLRRGDAVDVTVDAIDKVGQPRGGLALGLAVKGPEPAPPENLPSPLREASPGHYVGRFFVGRPGDYSVVAAAGDETVEATLPVPFPTRYESAAFRPGAIALLAGVTGGATLTTGPLLPSPAVRLTLHPAWQWWTLIALALFLSELVLRYFPGVFRLLFRPWQPPRKSDRPLATA